jgi:hypothetical protein
MEFDTLDDTSSLMGRLQAAGALPRDGKLVMPLKQLAAFLATGLVSVGVQAIDLNRQEAEISLPEAPRAAGDVFTLVSAVGQVQGLGNARAGLATLEVDELEPINQTAGGSGSGSGSSVWVSKR